MLCKSCGAVVEEGTKICPSCGEELVSAADPEAASGNLSEKQKDGNDFHKAVDPIKKLFRLNVYYVIVMFVVLVASALLVYRTGQFYDDKLSETGLEDSEIVIGWITMFLSVVEFGLAAGIVYEVHRLSEIRSYFRKVVYLGIAMITLAGVKLFTGHAAVTVASLLIGFLFCKFFCDSMRKMCLPEFYKPHRRWTSYWTVYVVMVFLTIGATVIYEITSLGIEYATTNLYLSSLMLLENLTDTYMQSISRYMTWTYGFLFLAFLFPAVAVFFRLKALKETEKAFEEA